MEAALAGSAGLPVRLRARALVQASALALVQNDFAQAYALADEGLRLWQMVGDLTAEEQGLMASAHSNLGASSAERGDAAQALQHFEQSLAIWRELHNLGNMAVTLSNLGFLALYQAEYARAVALCEECLVIQRELHNASLLPPALINLGLARLHLGEYGSAQALLQEALAQARDLDDKRNQALAFNYLGLAALALGDPAGAAGAYQASLRLARDLGNRFALARVLVGLAAVAGAQEQFGRAARLGGAAHAHHDIIAARLTPAERAWYERTLAAAQAHLGDAGFAAAQALGRALPIEEVIGYALESSGGV
jgi:tetratricopeptide (TPR) repeat protein